MSKTSHYFAEYRKIHNDIFRVNTRVFLEKGFYQKNEGLCIGAVVMINPGCDGQNNIQDGEWRAFSSPRNTTLSNILMVFKEASTECPQSFRADSYIQILNLFYIQDVNRRNAVKKLNNHNIVREWPVCEHENSVFPFLWYAWGDTSPLFQRIGLKEKEIELKQRFYTTQASRKFYLAGDGLHVGMPDVDDIIVHPMELHTESLNKHLKALASHIAQGTNA